MSTYGVPPIPTVGIDVLERYRVAHANAAIALDGLGVELRAVTLRWQLDLTEHALASIRPTVLGTDEPPLIPPPRAFLGSRNRARISGVRQALHHIDVRLTLLDEGLETTLIRPETPFVVNALVEGPDSTGHESNPGLIRARQSSWERSNNPYGHPPSAIARALAEQAVLKAQVPGHPAVVRGAWLAFTWMSIHPFVDGNGRTARFLYLLVAATELPLRFDYAVAEEIIHRRVHYIYVLRAGQWLAPSYDADIIDPAPFVSWLVEASAAANERLARRVETFARVDDDLARLMPGATPRQRALTLAVWLRQPAYPSRLWLDPEEHDPVDELEDLVDGDVLTRTATPPSRRDPDRWPRASYVVSDPVAATIATTIAQVQ